MRSLPLILLALIPAVAAARAQDDPLQTIEPAAPAASDLLAQARAAAARGDAAEALSRYLRVLATQPDDLAALTGAGQAALQVGDIDAAVAFFARAEDRAPRDAAVKAGLGRAMAQQGEARPALRFFREAVTLGVPETSIAADRGLAYDLRGDPRRAQADYQLALRTRPDEEVVRRLALSQAIGGDRVAALATLDPLLRRQDVPAWRTRAFVQALTGDAAAAERDALTVMARPQAETLIPYFARLSTLKPAEKAAAVHLGRFPDALQRTGRAAPTRVATVAPRPNPPPTLAYAQPPASVAPTVLAPPRPRGVLAFDQAAIRAPALPDAAAAPPPKPDPVVTARERAAFARAEAAAKAKADAAAKAKAVALAKAKQEREEAAEAKAAERRNPARQWVQVAGGANTADLPRAWSGLKEKWPKQLAGRTPWSTHYRFTNRLMIGPFKTEDEAQDWVTERRKEGFATFRVATRAGDEVVRLPAK